MSVCCDRVGEWLWVFCVGFQESQLPGVLRSGKGARTEDAREFAVEVLRNDRLLRDA